MKLKIRNLKILSGRPIAILNTETAKKLNIHVNERLRLTHKKIETNTLVDVSKDLIKKGEIGLSTELSHILQVKQGTLITASPSYKSTATEIIKKKLVGEELSKKEINLLISEISRNNLTESEIAYFVSAEKTHGLSFDETIYLIDAMVARGKKLSFNNKIIADKHCIGGVAGNRTTPIVVSICAAAGLTIPKSSSRAITSTAGTADVIETISKVELSSEKIKEVVKKTNGCLVWGGGLGLVPSDTAIIRAERLLNLDIESQMLASIMSKKIAAGSNHLLIDIPYGAGVKVSTLKMARKLGRQFKKIAAHFKIKISVVYTKGSRPIGDGVGPVLEIRDCLNVLRGKGPKDLRKKALYLSANLMNLCGVKNSKALARKLLDSGKAYEKFRQIINAQNEKKDFEKRITTLSLAKFSKDIFADKTGRIKSIGNKEINTMGRILGAPETHSAGLYFHRKSGKVKKGEKIITLYSESKQKLLEATKYFKTEKAVLIK